MRIPAPPPGFAVHGGALSCVSHGDEAANSIGGPATAAQAMATLHGIMKGLPCGQGDAAGAAKVRLLMTSAFEGASADNDIQSARITTTGRADSLAQTFAGERLCP